MKKCSVFFLFVLFFLCNTGQSIAQWHDWDEAHLGQITTNNLSYAFNEDVVFQGPSSIKVDYQNDGAITFPFRYDGDDIYYGGYFHLAIYNPSTTHKVDTFQVEFIDNNQVAAVAKGITTRKGWNRFEIQQKERYSWKYPLGFISLSNYIPRKPDKIRIKSPKGKSGTFYIGKLFFGKSMGSPKLQFDRVARPIPEEDMVVETPPENISGSAVVDLNRIKERLEETNGVAKYYAVASLETSQFDGLTKKVNDYSISTENGVVSGNNNMILMGSSDYDANEVKYSRLMNDVARNYRNVADATQKEALLEMYYKLFDFATFIGGMPDAWSGCDLYLTSVFLMRDKLQETGRLTSELVADYLNRIGYNRIFLNYSWYLKSYSSRFKTSDRGEDIDYIRIVSKQFAMLALMRQSDGERYRDMKQISKFYSEIAFRQSPGIADGYKSDGIAYHHWGWIDQYGTDGTYAAARIVYQLAGGEFKIKEEAHKTIKNQMVREDARSFMNIIPKHTSGKGGELYSYGGNGPNNLSRYAFMAKAGSPDGADDVDADMATIFLRYCRDLLSVSGTNQKLSNFDKKIKTELEGNHQANEMPEGHYTFGHGAMFVHRRAGWMITMKGHSKYQYIRESSDPFITYLGYGMLHCVKGAWNRYGWNRLATDLGQSGYDWRKYPGTTTVHFRNFNDFVNKEYKRYWSRERFVGGVNQEGNGVFTLPVVGSQKNNLGSFRAKKSWFCFDDFIVCVGSGITNSISAEVTSTNLYQDKISSGTKTYYNSTSALTGLSYSKNVYLKENAWMMDGEKLGYWVPAESKLVVKRGEQSSPNWSNKKTVTGNYATAWIEHGKAPKNATYWYVQRMNTTPQKMEQFSEAMKSGNEPFVLMRNDANVHAVYSNKHNAYGMVVFGSSSAINLKEIVSVSESCALMAKRDANDQLMLSVAQPDVDYEFSKSESNNQNWGYSQSHTINVELKGDWTFSEEKPAYASIQANGENTIVVVTVVEGKSFDVKLKENRTENTLDWVEVFNLNNTTEEDNGVTGWTVTEKADGATAQVEDGSFKLNGNATWQSKVIDAGNAQYVKVSGEIVSQTETDLAKTDSIKVFYSVNNGERQLIKSFTGNVLNGNFQLAGITGNNIQVFVQSKVDGTSKGYWLDNVQVCALSETMESLVLSNDELTMLEGDENTLTVTINPNSLSNEKVHWHSSDSNIATVDAEGKVLAKGVGEVEIIASANYVGMADTCQVVVNKRNTSAEKFALSRIALYPNPVKDRVVVSNPKNLKIERIVIVDLSGREVYQQDVNKITENISLDLTGLRKGIYLMKIWKENKDVLVTKIVKQ
ncbi:T9SS type A sorting domain-containing protein [Prolixibacteraceae bacterium JC049]|nr:T9SS type A sorting domain-containing protein [Prolixibacteraceae bacterium JC049]